MTTEKIPAAKWIFGSVILVVLLLHLDAFIFHTTFYGKSARDASDAWLLLTLACYAGSALIMYFGNKSRGGVDNGHYIGAGAVFILGMAAICGFSFPYA